MVFYYSMQGKKAYPHGADTQKHDDCSCFGINDVSPIKLSSAESVDKDFCGSNIGCSGNVILITKTENVGKINIGVFAVP